jgi:PGF-pre-PGF domain-containing protein
MNKKIFSILAFIIILLTVVVAVQAITISSAGVNESDNLYSNYTSNNIVNLLVTVSGANAVPGNNVTVTADFSALGVNCSGAGTSLINLSNSSATPNNWNASCNVADEAALSNFVGGPIVITANESYGAPSVTTVTVILYNMTTPPTGGCLQWGSNTINFTTISNFNAVNLTLEPMINLSCTNPTLNISAWMRTYTTVAMLNFTNLNLTDNNTIGNLSNLPSAIQVNISAPNSFGSSRIYFNSTMLASFNTRTTIVLYHLPFTSQPPIVADNGAAGVNTTTGWVQGLREGNLTFVVNGFSGYNMTDNIVPTLTVNAPLSGIYTTNNNTIINVSLNGTDTQISQAFFYVNGAMIANYTNISNTANCTNVTEGSELFQCYFNLSNKVDGVYNLTVIAYDYGGNSPGNTANTTVQFTVDNIAPVVTIVNPTNNTVNSTFVINVTVVEANVNYTQINVTNSTGSVVNTTTSSSNGSITLSPTLAEGVYNITVITYDLAGRTAIKYGSNITYDALPTGTITTPSANTTYINPNLNNYTFIGTANDTYGVANVTLTVNNILNGTAMQNYNSTTTVWNYTIYGLNATAQILYNITVNITDTAGNLYQINRTIILDNVYPTINITNPANNTRYDSLYGSVLQLDFNASDNSGTLNSCWYSLSGTLTKNNVPISNCTSSANMSIQYLYLANGTYNLTLYVNDSFNNINSSLKQFTVNDTVVPVLSSSGPSGAQGSVSTVTLTVTTFENTTCEFNRLYNFTSGTNIIFSNDNITQHTKTGESVDAGSSYTYYYRCTDMSGNIGYSSVSFSISGSTGGSGGSSGGGGGGGGATPDPSKTVTYDLIAPGSKVITIDSTSIPLSEIFLTTIASATNVKFVVTATTSPTSTYTGKVYKYLKIDHDALDNSKIDNAKIKFKIEKNWLTSNGKTKEEIYLVRYDASKWTELITTITNDDSNYVYYLADSPGLSLFAISTKAPVVVANNTGNLTGNVTTNNSGTNGTVTTGNATNNSTGNNTSTPTAPKNPYNGVWTVVIFIVIFGIIIFIVAKKSKKDNSPPIHEHN